METLLLGDALYVQERYEELDAEKKRRAGQAHYHHHGDAHGPRRDLTTRSDDQATLQRPAEDADDRLAKLRALDAAWPLTLEEKRMRVMEATLLELTALTRRALEETERLAVEGEETQTDTSTEPSTAAKIHDPAALPADALTPKRLDELPMSSQLSLKMFFRLCASLRSAGQVNGRLLGMIAQKIPAMLDSLPPLSLSPGIVDCALDSEATVEASGTPTRSVFQELLNLYGDFLEVDDNHDNASSKTNGTSSQADRANAVMAYVALSLKWGRLRDLVQAMLLMVQHPDLLSTQHTRQLHKLLTELGNAQAEVPSQPLLPQDSSPVGILVSFGKGDHGKLGHGQCAHASCSEGNCTENKNVPTVIASTRDVKFIKIDSLSTHSIAITTKGEVMAWGNGDKYRLGHGTTSKEYAPRIIDSLSLKGTVTDVACGLGHTIALMSGGAIYAWGNGSNGRLGLGDTNDRSSPTKVPIPEESALRSGSSTFRYVMCGASHSLALTSDGIAFAWGKNNQGQCGHGHTNDQLVVAEVKHFREELGERVAHASGGWEHTLFCSVSGRVYSCGCGYKDSRRTGIPPVLGHGDCEKRLKPSVIQVLADANEEIVRVSCGWDHSLAVSAEGGLYTWGSGTNGKLGHGDEENCEVPTLVRSLSGKIVKDAKAGCEHTVAITSDHEVWTFGQGDSGRLGLGDTITRKSPTLVEFFSQTGLRPVAIAVGDKYNLILAEDAGSSGRHANGTSPTKSISPSKFRQGHSVQFGDLGAPNRLRRHQSVAEALKRTVTVGSSLRFEGNAAIKTNLTAEEAENSQGAVISFIASHVARISGEYLQKLGETHISRVQTQSNSTMLLPFGVDPSEVTVGRLLALITHVQDHDFQNPSISDHVEKVSVIINCLRLLTVNISYWSESHVPARRSETDQSLFGRVHDIAVSFATNGVGQLIAEDPTQRDHIQQLDNVIREEAALILKVGFTSFFPTRDARENLLWELISSPNARAVPTPVHTKALVAKLSEDSIMGEIVRKNFERSTSHGCLKTSDKANDTSLFQQNSKLLLEACLLDPRERFEDNDTMRGHGVGVLLQLLGVLQGHGFAVASCRSVSPDIGEDNKDAGAEASWSGSACDCAFEWLVDYLAGLFDGSVGILKLLRKAIGVAGTEDYASGSILDKVLLPAIQATNALVSPAHRRDQHAKLNREDTLRFVERLLPRVKAMLVLVDEVVWRTQSQGNESAAARRWIFELGEACAILFGQLSSQLMLSNTRADGSCDLKPPLEVLLGAPQDIVLIGSHRASTSAGLIMKWEDSSERQMQAEECTNSSQAAGAEESAHLRKCLEDEILRTTLLANIQQYRNDKTAPTNTQLDSTPNLLRDCGFVLIAWFGGISSSLKDGTLSDGSDMVLSKKIGRALVMFEAIVSTGITTSHNENELIERTEQLLGVKSTQFARVSSLPSLQQWVTALHECLVEEAFHNSLEEAVLEYVVRPSLYLIGLTSHTDALHMVSSPSLKGHLLRQLFNTTVNRGSCLPSASSSYAGLASTVENLGRQLVNAVSADAIDNVGKAKALGVWLWMLCCGSMCQSKLSELIASTGVILHARDFLILLSSRQYTRLDDHPPIRAELTVAKDKRHTQQWTQRFTPVEALMVVGMDIRRLTTVGFELISVITEKLCGDGSATVDEIHPLLLAPSISAASAPSRPASSPRRSQTLPRKTAVLTTSESRKAAFDCVVEVLQRNVSEYEVALDVLSPLIQADHSNKQHTRPMAAFLLASPISISKSRSHIGKPLRIPLLSHRSHSLLARAVSFWVFVDDTSPSPTSIPRLGPASYVNLLALGSMSDRLQESAASTGSNQVTEVEAADPIWLTVFRLSNGSDGVHSVGYAVKVAGDELLNSQWQAFVSVEPLQARKWTHIVVSVDGPGSVMYINGRATPGRPLPAQSLSAREGLPSGLSHRQINARMQIVCGGSLSDSFLRLLGVTAAHQTEESIASPQEVTAGMNGLVDDVWLFTTTIDIDSARALYEQGPTFLQAKNEFEAEVSLLRTLRLFDQMLHAMPLNHSTVARVGKSETLSCVVELLFRALRLSQRVSCYEIAITISEVLQKILPSPNSPEPTRDMLATVIACMRTGRRDSSDIRALLFKLYAFGSRAGVQSTAVTASQAAMHTLFTQQGITKTDSAGDSYRGSYPIQSAGGRHLVDASLVHLLQTLAFTPAWRPLFVQLLDESAAIVQALSDNGYRRLVPTTVAVMISGGYSEFFINDLKLSVLSSEPTVKSLLSMDLEIPWSSLTYNCSGMDTKWSTVSSQFSLSVLDDSWRLPHHHDANDILQTRATDYRLAKVFELQARILRSMAFQASVNSISTREWHHGILSNTTVLHPLLRLCALPVKELLSHRLGPNANQAYRLSSVRSLMSSLIGRKGRSRGRQNLLVQDEVEVLVETLSTRLEDQQHSLEVGIMDIEQTTSWRLNRHRAAAIEPLGGEVIIQGLTVQAVQHFPTVRLGRVVITANSGLWYYEVQVLTDGLMQIGYVDGEFVADAIQGQGVGDQTNSWAFDGYRCKKWNVSPVEYGEMWKAGDVVGVLLDTDRMELSYFLNNKFLGIAFTTLPLTSTTVMHPAVSLNADQRVRFNFGRRNDARANGLDYYAQNALQLPSLQSPLDQQRLQAVVYAMEEVPDEEVEIESQITSDEEMESCEEGDEELLRDNGDACDVDDDTKVQDADSEEVLHRILVDESVSVYHRSGLHASRQLPGSVEGAETASFSERSIVDSISIHPDPRAGRQDSRREGSEDEDQDDEHADGEVMSGSREAELVEGLVNLGFPRSWAARCAQETSFSVNDSGAVSWILEQMEKDATSSVLRSFSDISRPTDNELEQSALELSAAEKPRRAQDDLSLVGSSSSASGVRRLLHLTLSPTRDSRPHTEQHTRNRELISSPERPRPTNASSRRGQPLSMNPFLSTKQQEEEDEDHEGEEGDVIKLLSTACYQTYSLAVEKLLRRECLGLVADDDASKSKDGNNRSTTCEEDLVPACVVAQSLLSLCYCRLIVQSTLFGEASDPSITYPVVIQWIEKGRSGLCQFLRIQLQLNASDLPAAVNRACAATHATTLSEGIVSQLKYEASRSLVSGVQELLLLQTLLKEVRSQTMKAARYVTRFRMRRSSHHDESTSKIMVLAMDARWTLWLLSVVQRSLEPLTSASKAAMDTVVVAISPPFVDDLTKLAASATGVYAPWQTAAFQLIKISLAICSRAANDGSTGGSGDIIPLEYLIERLNQTMRKELPRATLLSINTRTLWEIALRHLPPPPIPQNVVPLRTTTMQLHIEQLASTYTTISWKCADPGQAATDDVVEEEGSQVNRVSPIENCALSLEVCPTTDRLSRSRKEASSSWLPNGLHPGVPHLLPSSGSLVLRHLAPDSCYKIRLVKTTADEGRGLGEAAMSEEAPKPSAIEVCELQIQTPPEQVFELSNDACGKNLVLSNRNRTVKNLVNKKWHTVRASVAFDEGVHHWHVRIDSCVSKNIFIGICTAEANLENYIGSDAYGYGFLANKAVWHNKSKLQSYGEIFKQGDIIQVALDCNARTLSYSRNGEFLGVAATNLNVGGSSLEGGGGSGGGQADHKWYPAVSLYNKDDQLTIIVPPSTFSSSASACHQRPQFATVLELVDSARLALGFSRLAHLPYAETKPETAREVSKTFEIWRKWRNGELLWREVALCDIVQIDASRDSVVHDFGLGPGDSIFTSRGHCVVLGVAKHELWYEVLDGLDSSGAGKPLSIGSWSLHTCREMLRYPDDYPVHRSRRQRIASGVLSTDIDDIPVGEGEPTSEPLNASQSATALETTKAAFNAQSRRVDDKMDMQLVSLMDAVAWHRGVSSPHQLTSADLSSALVLHDIVDVFKAAMASANHPILQQEDLLMRLAALLDLNQHVYRVIRLFFVPDFGFSQWEQCLSVALDPADRSSPDDTIRSRLTVAARLAASLEVSRQEISVPAATGLHSATVLRRVDVVQFLSARLFAGQREKIISDSLRRTATLTLTPSANDSKSSDLGAPDDTAQNEPKEMIRIQIQAPTASESTTPFWQHESAPPRVWFVPPPGERRTRTRFAQLSKQLASVAPHELRRECVTSTDPSGITRTFHIVQGESSETGQLAASLEAPTDQPSLYLKLLDDVFTEIQSPSFPLFIPDSSPRVASSVGDWDAPTVCVQLDVNAHLLLPEFAGRCQVRVEEALLWFFHVGQLLGVVWRSRCLAPLQFISVDFWQRLLTEDESSISASSEGDRLHSGGVMATRAVRDGLCSVIPAECLQLSTAETLRWRLSGRDVWAIDKLRSNAAFDHEASHHSFFWSVVRSFSTLERAILMQFLRGKPSPASGSWEDSLEDPIESWKRRVLSTGSPPSEQFRLELAAPLPDALAHPDACFPVVDVIDHHLSRLHLPEYSSVSVLRQKLLFAMYNQLAS